MKPIVFILLWLGLLSQDSIPFKPNDQFELTTAFTFKTRSKTEDQVNWSAQPKDMSTQLPYLEVTVKILVLDTAEARIRITNNHGDVLANKKVNSGDRFALDMGFTDDMKDRTHAHEYIFHFVSENKKTELSRIVIHVAEDGRFFVNGEQRGKL